MTVQTATLREFAAIINTRPSYVKELLTAGRLVTEAGGKTIRVAESIARIEATRDPSKAGVAARHAAERGAPALTGHAPAPSPSVDAGEAPEDDGKDAPRYDFQGSKAKREHWAAEREHALYRKEAGELIERSDHVAAFAALGAMVRSKVETWAAVLPPQLVGRDEAAIRATLADQVEQLLTDLAAAAQKQGVSDAQ